ncbi:MAG: hypothetical protein LBP54_04425 [Campylobacteraceae bacterium]|nr:hypothetical protein [Campylobacteraceae bacterium]
MKIPMLLLAAVFLTGCGTKNSFIPLNEQQLGGIYKIYSRDYASSASGEEIAITQVYFSDCKNDTTCKDKQKRKIRALSYVQVINNKYCKIIDSTIEEDEISAIEKLRRQSEKICSFDDNELSHKRGSYLFTFAQNKNGDFINSELLMLDGDKIISRKANFSDKRIQLYDKNGIKLLDKAYEKLFFPDKTCEKVAVKDEFDYRAFSINASKPSNTAYKDIAKTLKKAFPIANRVYDVLDYQIVSENADGTLTIQPKIKDKIFEELLKGKFFAENKNSSNIKILSPFGYLVECGMFYLDRQRTIMYCLYDKDGNLMFDDLESIWKIDNSRFYARSIYKVSGKKYHTRAFLYNADNKEIVFTADDIKSWGEFDLLSVVKDGKYGLIDFDGNIVVDYQDKYNIKKSFRGIVVAEYYDRKKYWFTLLDLELNPIIDKVKNIYFWGNFFVAHMEGRMVFFDYSKKIVHDLKADNFTFYRNFFAAASKNKSTLYDYSGNKLLNKTYANLTSVGDDLFSYSINGKTALMDANAKEIIPSVCDSIKLGVCGTIECINWK